MAIKFQYNKTSLQSLDKQLKMRANSAHAFGTTFDVSYRRFCKVEDPDGRPMA